MGERFAERAKKLGVSLGKTLSEAAKRLLLFRKKFRLVFDRAFKATFSKPPPMREVALFTKYLTPILKTKTLAGLLKTKPGYDRRRSRQKKKIYSRVDCYHMAAEKFARDYPKSRIASYFKATRSGAWMMRGKGTGFNYTTLKRGIYMNVRGFAAFKDRFIDKGVKVAVTDSTGGVFTEVVVGSVKPIGAFRDFVINLKKGVNKAKISKTVVLLSSPKGTVYFEQAEYNPKTGYIHFDLTKKKYHRKKR